MREKLTQQDFNGIARDRSLRVPRAAASAQQAAVKCRGLTFDAAGSPVYPGLRAAAGRCRCRRFPGNRHSAARGDKDDLGSLSLVDSI
jgi:hypothetical protein